MPVVCRLHLSNCISLILIAKEGAGRYMAPKQLAVVGEDVVENGVVAAAGVNLLLLH